MGINKLITHFTIVKPKVERVHFVEKSNSGSLADMMTGKMFLQKYKGIKSKMNEETFKKAREDDRKRRTFSKDFYNMYYCCY